MRQALPILALILGLLLAGCEDTDIGLATQAGIEAVKAVTLDDEDVQRLAAAVSVQYDRKHTVAPPDNPYAERLQRLTAPYTEYAGHAFDFKVYLSPKVNAQFSQQEERAADDFGLAFLQNQGLGEQAAISAMMKLASLGNDHSFLSSHPAPEARAERLTENAHAPAEAEKPSLLKRLIGWLWSLWPFGGDTQARKAENTFSPNYSDYHLRKSVIPNVHGYRPV